MMKMRGLVLTGLLLPTVALSYAENAGGMEEIAAQVQAITQSAGNLGAEELATKGEELQGKLIGENIVKDGGCVIPPAPGAKLREKSSPKRKVYHVTPAGPQTWRIKAVGAKRTSYIVTNNNANTLANAICKATKAVEGMTDKECAVAIARHLAKKAKLGQVVIHGRNGRIQKEYTYGKDPFPPKG